MLLAILLFVGFIGVALTLLLGALASLDVAFSVWDYARRARRSLPVVVQQIAEKSAPLRTGRRVSQWAQSAGA